MPGPGGAAPGGGLGAEPSRCAEVGSVLLLWSRKALQRNHWTVDQPNARYEVGAVCFCPHLLHGRVSARHTGVTSRSKRQALRQWFYPCFHLPRGMSCWRSCIWSSTRRESLRHMPLGGRGEVIRGV